MKENIRDKGSINSKFLDPCSIVALGQSKNGQDQDALYRNCKRPGFDSRVGPKWSYSVNALNGVGWWAVYYIKKFNYSILLLNSMKEMSTYFKKRIKLFIKVKYIIKTFAKSWGGGVTVMELSSIACHFK